MKRHAVIAILLALSALAFVLYPQRFSSGGTALGQKRRRPAPRKPRATAAAKDYSTFLHATKEHTGACNTCHKVPTTNARKVRGFPDVADYPGHAACVSCHRKQFFTGAQPVICSDCHQKTSPRTDEQYVFRNPVRPQQFMIEFPHDRHQDVIATLMRPPAFVTQVRFAHAVDERKTNYSYCTMCHTTNTKAPVAPPGGWVDGVAPKVDALMDSPSGHSSCFNCHWDGQRPTREDCKGCHKLVSPYVPVSTPKRNSMKFTHAREQHTGECTKCHINITKSATLVGLKPDVPITTCTECHNKAGQRQDLDKELAALDKNKEFVCVYCHTSDVGKRDPKPSHYLAAGRSVLRRKDLK